MTKLLDEVLERVRSWPKERQDDAARLLLAMERHDERTYTLSPEERAQVRAGLEEADRGEFATEEEVAAVFKRSRS